MAGNLFDLYTWTNSTGTITITLASLAFAASPYLAGQASTAVDNTTTLAPGAQVVVRLKNGAGTITTPFGAFIYAYGTADGGTTYGEGITGTDAAKTLTNPPNLRLIGFLNMPVSATQYTSDPMSVEAAYNGVLPAKWGIHIVNATGVNFDATAGSHFAKYQLVGGSYT